MGRASFKGHVIKREVVGMKLGDQMSSLMVVSVTSRLERWPWALAKPLNTVYQL